MPARQNNGSENSKRPSVTTRMWLAQSFPARDGALGGGAFHLDLPGWTPTSASDFCFWLGSEPGGQADNSLLCSQPVV